MILIHQSQHSGVRCFWIMAVHIENDKKGDLLCDGVKYGNNVVFFEDLSLKTYSRRAQYQNQDFVKWQNMASLIVINNVTAHFFVCRGEI